MPYVTRFHIQRLTDRNRTEFYTDLTGSENWMADIRDAVEFSTAARAAHRADRVGGEVVEYRRPATAFEAMMLARQDQFHAIAAE
jgi:hypothetical protein